MEYVKLALMAMLALAAPARAVSSYSGSAMNSKRAALAFNQNLDVAEFSHFSVQIEFADAAPSAVTRTFNRVSTDDTIYIPAHNLPVGLGVVLSTGNNLVPTGLEFGATYFIIAYSDDYVKLSTDTGAALAGTAVDVTAVSAISSASITLTPQPLASPATDGIKYQATNDGVTYYDLSVTSAPYDAATVGALTQFVDPTYKTLRLKFTGPTTGALSIKANVSGRR